MVSSLVINLKLFLTFGQSEPQCSYKVWTYKKSVQKINTQLITCSFLMIQTVSFTSAAFEVFAEVYLCFLVSATAKKCQKLNSALSFYTFFVLLYQFLRNNRKNVNLSLFIKLAKVRQQNE